MSDEYLPASLAPQAAAPRETDYELIHAAVTETERGRWFLGEYARRNRHADTEQVLTAIARLEVALVATREAGQPTKSRGDIATMLAAIAAPPKSGPNGAIDKTALELDAIIKATERATTDILAAAERIQEIAWTMREQGADDRSCDELDGLATDIYTACGFQDLTGQQTDRVIEHLRHPDVPEETGPRLDQAGVDRVVSARVAAIAAAAVIELAAEAVAGNSGQPVAADAPPAEPMLEPATDVAAPADPEPDEPTLAASPAREAAAASGIEVVAAAPDRPAEIVAAAVSAEAALENASPAAVDKPAAAEMPVEVAAPPPADLVTDSADALLADLLAMIRQAKKGKPQADAAPAAPASGDWNRPLFPPPLDDDITWVDPAAPEPGAKPAEPATNAATDLIDDDDLLMPVPPSWTPPSQTASSQAAAPPADAAPAIVALPAATPAPALAEPAPLAASARTSPLAAVAVAALAGEPLSSVAAVPSPMARVEQPADTAARPPVSSQALAAVAALATLSDAEKIALFS